MPWLGARARGSGRSAPGPPEHCRTPPADGPAVRQPPPLAANSPAIEILRQRADGAKLEIARKDRANRLSHFSFPPGDHGETGGAAMRQIVDPLAGLGDRPWCARSC